MLGFVQAVNAFIQQAVDDQSLLVGGKLNESLVLIFLDRFTKQLDMGLQNGFDHQQFLRQRQQWRIKVHVGYTVGFLQRIQQAFDCLGRYGQVQHVERVTQLLQRCHAPRPLF